MGLLGNGYDDPRSAANMALAAGLLQGNMGAGLLGANQAYGNAQNDALKRQLVQAQMQETQAQAQERQIRAQREQEALERSRAIQMAVPGLFQQGAPGAPGGAGGFDVQRAIQLGMTPEQIQAYAGLQNVGRPKATRQMEVDDGKGGKRIALVDDFGNEVAGFNGYTAPVQVNQGDRVSFVKPQAGMSLGVGMSPSERDASARGWASNNLSAQRLAMDRDQATAGKVPAGYRAKADGTLEFIPGGPADPNAAKRAAPTEFQGKAGMFGNRALEADKIISGLEGKYSPSAVNAKMAADNAPWYLGGGVTGAIGNAVTSKEAQMAEQAQRDFINAVLRLESGAAIAESEFTNAKKQYFPQPCEGSKGSEPQASH
jgi:hypothetical protein